jgi:hypothetical protein
MRNRHGSLSPWVAAAVAAIATLALSAGGASASINYNASKSNTGNVAVQPAACPAGETVVANPTTGKPECVAAPSKTYNSSHSNTAGEGPCPTCAKCVNPKGCS